jgi:hypothetical protein
LPSFGDGGRIAGEGGVNNMTDSSQIFEVAKAAFLEINSPSTVISVEKLADGIANAVVKALEEYDSQSRRPYQNR